MKTAIVRHILVKDKELASQLKKKILDGADFTKIAKQHSTCPSAKKGIYPGKPSISNVYNLIIVCKRISLEDAPTITSNVPAGSINCSFVVSQ